MGASERTTQVTNTFSEDGRGLELGHWGCRAAQSPPDPPPSPGTHWEFSALATPGEGEGRARGLPFTWHLFPRPPAG